MYGTAAPSYSCAGGGSIPLSRGCYKAKFSVPSGDEFSTVKIPLTSFSDMWSPATGEHTKECKDDPDVCPAAEGLKKIKRIEVWAEGALGKIHLELKSIGMEPSSSVAQLNDSTQPPAEFNSCQAPVQAGLRYGIASRMDTFGGASSSESLAESVCCDSRNKLRAEPQFLFEAPDIQLFSSMEKGSEVTTFYDSVCGVPLFRAPVNRSLAEFEADTNEHGWPSFRPAEVVHEHVITNKTSGLVTSTCGTHLGSFLPDSEGARWCMDLSCIAGNKI